MTSRRHASCVPGRPPNLDRKPARLLATSLNRIGWLLLALLAGKAEAEDAAVVAPATAPPLAAREADLLRRYDDLERSFLRLADLLAATDPRRAAVLRDAFGQAREAAVGERLGTIVALLEEGRLLEAGTSQAGAIEQFRGLLAMLEEGGSDRNLADTKQDVREFLSRIGTLIARQRDLEGSTEAGADEPRLAARQREAADEASRLADDLDAFAKRIDERPTDRPTEQPTEPAGEEAAPDAATGDDDASRAQRTQARITAAEQRMRKAREALETARRRDARAEQEEAIAELETARAELEEILRQLREEEVERLLVQLETRIRTLIRMERSVQAAAEALATAEEMATRERQIEAARIGREQEAVTAELGKTLAVVRDDGSAVAIPEALSQIRDDSLQAATRIGRGDVGETTQAIVNDILVGLEELLTAVEKSRKSEQAAEDSGPGGGRPPEPGEQPLVDTLAELKMLRSLQVRVNARTAGFARLLDGGTEAADEPALVDALRRLAERQQAIERAARDIVAGRTE